MTNELLQRSKCPMHDVYGVVMRGACPSRCPQGYVDGSRRRFRIFVFLHKRRGEEAVAFPFCCFLGGHRAKVLYWLGVGRRWVMFEAPNV